MASASVMIESCLPAKHAPPFLPAAEGTEVTVDMDNNVLTDHSTGATYALQEIGEVGLETLAVYLGGRRRNHKGLAVSCRALGNQFAVSAPPPGGTHLLLRGSAHLSK